MIVWTKLGPFYPQCFERVLLCNHLSDAFSIGYCEHRFVDKTHEEMIEYFGSEEEYQAYQKDWEWQEIDMDFSTKKKEGFWWFDDKGKELPFIPTHFCALESPPNVVSGEIYQVIKE